MFHIYSKLFHILCSKLFRPKQCVVAIFYFLSAVLMKFLFFFISVDNEMPGTLEANNAKTCHSLIPRYYMTKSSLLCFL